MDINVKIQDNIKQQFLFALRSDKIRAQMRQLEADQQAAVGAMSVLSELYKEENGVELQHSINTDPEWKKITDACRAEAEKVIASEALQVASGAQGAEKSQHTVANGSQTKQVDTNRLAVKKVNTPNANEVRPLPALRTKTPIKLSVDSNSPAGPGEEIHENDTD